MVPNTLLVEDWCSPISHEVWADVDRPMTHYILASLGGLGIQNHWLKYPSIEISVVSSLGWNPKAQISAHRLVYLS